MKRLVVLSTLFALLLSACGGEATPTAAPIKESLPVIAVDAEHMLTPNLFYEIPAGAGFVLDASAYVFGTASGPTLVQVIVNSHEYQGQWNAADNIQTVRAAELFPPVGFQPLSEFTAGQMLIVAIGTLSESGRFSPLWAAAVNVR